MFSDDASNYFRWLAAASLRICMVQFLGNVGLFGYPEVLSRFTNS